jgi:hypothetical protein
MVKYDLAVVTLAARIIVKYPIRFINQGWYPEGEEVQL